MLWYECTSLYNHMMSLFGFNSIISAWHYGNIFSDNTTMLIFPAFVTSPMLHVSLVLKIKYSITDIFNWDETLSYIIHTIHLN